MLCYTGGGFKSPEKNIYLRIQSEEKKVETADVPCQLIKETVSLRVGFYGLLFLLQPRKLLKPSPIKAVTFYFVIFPYKVS